MPGLVLPASTPLPFAATAVGVELIGGGFLLVGFAVEETTVTARARIVLRDGNNDAAEYRLPITLGPGESRAEGVAHLGIMFESGLWVQVASGTVAGTILVVPTELLVRDGGMVLIGQQNTNSWVDLGVLT